MRKLLFLIVMTMSGITGCAGMADSSAAPAATPHAYATDLANTVVLAMLRGNEDDELLRQIGIVAQRHGLSDWESVDDSYVAIGAGLREAEVSAATAASVADTVSGGDALRRQLVLQSFGT